MSHPKSEFEVTSLEELRDRLYHVFTTATTTDRRGGARDHFTSAEQTAIAEVAHAILGTEHEIRKKQPDTGNEKKDDLTR